MDGTEIVYQLHSYFQVSANPGLGQEELELRISAESLLLEQVVDLRVVSRGLAAPGRSIPGVLEGFPWAKRRLKWAELSGAEFTIGSYREATVLPIRRKIENE